MTLDELVEEVLENVSLSPKYESVQTGEIKRLLNLAQREVSQRLGAPRQEVTVPTVGVISGRFRLPGRFQPEAVQRVHVVEGYAESGARLDGQELRILSPGETLDFHSHQPPRHEHQRHAPALRYDRADPGLAFEPLGIEEARYRFLLQPIPPDMEAGSDEPFAALDYCEEPPLRTAGALPGGHRILAHHVSYELLQRMGDEQWRAFFVRYQQMEQELFARVSPTTVYLPGFTLAVSGG